MSSSTNFALQVSWDLPLFPNGRINNYVLQYVQLDSDMTVSRELDAIDTTKEVDGPSFVIDSLPPFTYFKVTVYAMNGLQGFPTSFTERTNASGEPSVQQSTVH